MQLTESSKSYVAVLLLLVIGTLSCKFSGAAIGDEFCQRTQHRVTVIPNFPSFYTTSVECNALEQNRTTVASIVYDGNAEKSLLATRRRSGTVYYLYDGGMETTWTDAGSECHVRPVNESFNAILMLYIVRGDWLRNNLNYNGSEILRGMPTDTWNSCFYMEDLRTMIDMDMHFLVTPDWDTPGPNLAAVPVRLDVRGRQYKEEDSQKWSDFHHVYDYFDFSTEATDNGQELLQLYPGLYCPGRPRTLDFPIVPDIFSYQSERVDLVMEQISFQSVWYNSNLKMLKTSGKLSADDSQENVIYDFNTATKYSIEIYNGACVTTAIKADDMMVSKGNGLQMVSTKELVGATEPDAIQFVGKRAARDVPCDVWIGNYFDEVSGFNMTKEWYFASPPWVLAPGNVYEIGALVKMISYKVSKEAKPEPVEVVNIMRFDDTEITWSEFDDVTKCFKPADKIRFILTLKVGEQSMKFVRAKNAVINIRKTIAKQLGIEPLRLPDCQFEYDGLAHAFFYSTLLDAPLAANDRVNQTFNSTNVTAAYDQLVSLVHGSFMFMEEEVLMEATFIEKIVSNPEHKPTLFPTPPTASPLTRGPTHPQTPATPTVLVPSTMQPPTVTHSTKYKVPTRHTFQTPPTIVVTSSETRAPTVITNGVTTSTRSQCSCPTAAGTPCGSSNAPNAQSPSVNGYSAGAMAGVGVGMLAVGAILAVLAMRVYSSRRRTDPMTLSLVEIPAEH